MSEPSYRRYRKGRKQELIPEGDGNLLAIVNNLAKLWSRPLPAPAIHEEHEEASTRAVPLCGRWLLFLSGTLGEIDMTQTCFTPGLKPVVLVFPYCVVLLQLPTIVHAQFTTIINSPPTIIGDFETIASKSF